MNTAACTAVAPRNMTNRGAAAVTMNCRSITPAANPTMDLANPPTPMTPLDSASWTMPAAVAGQHPRDRAGLQRDIDHHYQHQIERRGTAHQKPRQGRLPRERQRDGDQDPGGSHSRAPLGSPSAPAGVVTTSTASSVENSTAGRTTMAAKSPAPRSADSI